MEGSHLAVVDFTFRRYRPEDFEEYAAVYQAVYGKRIDEAFFQWKNLKNPALAGEALIYLALSGGRIIGANSFFPSILAYQGQTYRAVQSGDTMVLASHRGQGIFQKILKYAAEDLKAEGYAAIYGYANGNSYPGFLKFGFSDLGRVNIHYRILNWRGFLANRGNAWGAAGWALDQELQLFGLLGAWGRRGYTVSLLDFRYDAIPQSLGEFLERAVRNPNFDPYVRLLKNRAYLAWKYRDKPAAEYQVLAVYQDGELAGVLFLRLDKHGEEKAGEIVECFVHDSGQARAIMGAALEFLRKDKFAFVKMWDPNQEAVKKGLKGNFFIKRKVALYFIVKVLQGGLDFLTERRVWLISGGDADTA